ncbi:MAG: 4-hydroxybenzoate octaprenyltransferase [Actinobacteria bacterium]|nr:MAG: 4-hydroxybenzoate octaprenyltransferase [Actinomycetota bacterium]
MRKLAEKTRIFLELVKFEHSIFALPYAYIGALYGAVAAAEAWQSRLGVTAELFAQGEAAVSTALGGSGGGYQVSDAFALITPAGWPTWWSLLWITVVMVGARAFAFVVNRAVDKEIDARNPRTAGRAIPAGLVKAWELWVFSAVMLAAYLYGVWQLAPICRWLWPIPLAAFVLYPYTKRFTPLCHYWLGLCLGLAPVGGWVAVGGPIASPAPWVLGAAVLLWTAGFDIIYATQDVECDERDGVHSMPADYGVPKALVQTRVDHVLTVALLLLGGWLAGAGWPWFTGVGVAGALLWYENSIVRADDLSRVNAAFFTVNGVIAVIVFLGALADRLLA